MNNSRAILLGMKRLMMIGAVIALLAVLLVLWPGRRSDTVTQGESEITAPQTAVATNVASRHEDVKPVSSTQSQNQVMEYARVRKQTTENGRFEVVVPTGTVVAVQRLTKAGYEEEFPAQGQWLRSYGAQSGSFSDPMSSECGARTCPYV